MKQIHSKGARDPRPPPNVMPFIEQNQVISLASGGRSAFPWARFRLNPAGLLQVRPSPSTIPAPSIFTSAEATHAKGNALTAGG